MTNTKNLPISTKLVLISLVVFFLLFASYIAMADPHTLPYEPSQPITIETTVNHYYTEKAAGNALGAALGSSTFDRQENKWQSAISGAYIDQSAVAFHAGKRLCNGCFLNFSIGKEGDKTGGVVTYNWTW